MKQKIAFTGFLSVLFLSGIFSISCAEKTFTKINRCQNFYKPCINKDGMDIFDYSFSVEGKVRIEVFMDNSGSMADEHQRFTNGFGNLRLPLQGMKWQAGISLTDTDKENRILFDGQPFLTWETANPLSAFKAALPRPESVECRKNIEKMDAGADPSLQKIKKKEYNVSCPSDRESGMEVAKKLIQNSHTSLAIQGIGEVAPWTFVMVSDEDDYNAYRQYKDASHSERTQIIQQEVVQFENELNQSLKGIPWVWNSIIVRPEDENCLKEQTDQGNARNLGYYGYFYDELSKRTGGKVIDICQSDYGSALKDIGQDIADKLNTIGIACQQPENLHITIKDKVNNSIRKIEEVDYIINNKVIEFNQKILDVGSEVSLNYRCYELM